MVNLKFSYRYHLFSLITLAFLGALIYSQTWHHEFLTFDDMEYVSQNSHVNQGISLDGLHWAFYFRHSDQNYWRPLAWLSHMVDYHIFGGISGGHYLHNYLLHIINAILLYTLLYRMTGRWRSSFLVALLFVVHPINVESVAWLVERSNVLCMAFGLITLHLYYSYVRNPDLKRYLLVIIVFMFCLMAKPLLITLPFLMLLIDFWPLQRTPFSHTIKGVGCNDGQVVENKQIKIDKLSLSRLVVEKVPMIALSIAVIVIALQRVGGTIPVPFSLRIENALVSYFKYIGHLLFPINLHAFYPFPESVPNWQSFISLAGLVSISVYVSCKVFSKPYLFVGWFWFVGTLMPQIGIVQAGLWPALADRWAYFPSIGLFIVLAFSINDFIRDRFAYKKICLGLLFGVVAFYTIICHVQVGYWSNSQTLYRRIIEKDHDNYLAHNNLGVVLRDKEGIQVAEKHFRKAIDANPWFDIAYHNLGSVLTEREDIEGAIALYLKAIKLNPRSYSTQFAIGKLYASQANYPAAIKHFSKAINLQPNTPITYNNMGDALTKNGQLRKAVRFFEMAIALDPEFKLAHNNLKKLKQFMTQAPPED